MKNMKSLFSFADNIVGGMMNIVGVGAGVFILCLPIIFLLAFIKWAVTNGYI